MSTISTDQLHEAITECFRRAYSSHEQGAIQSVTIHPDGKVEHWISAGVSIGMDEWEGVTPHECTVWSVTVPGDPDPCSDYGSWNEDDDLYWTDDGESMTEDEVIDACVFDAMEQITDDDIAECMSTMQKAFGVEEENHAHTR